MIKKAEKTLKFSDLEERIQKWWKDRRIYEKSKSSMKDKKKYYFLDGPPYASGAIHLGTAWNKILKDAIVRYLSMKGYNVRRQAGWDCHGLPIEVKVEEKLGIKNKKDIEKIGVDKFVAECRKWAYDHVSIMTDQFSRLGVWMDWDKPYMTLKDEYIEAAWWTIKKAHEKDLLTKDLRVVTWCPRCETALAEAEIVYEDREDPSIYVKFPLNDGNDEYILIWTTTPWTLIGNLAIMVNPEFEYVKAKTKEGTLILAHPLVNVLEEELGLDYEIIEVMKGKDLEGLRYNNPLSDLINIEVGGNAYSIILSDSVTLEEGTGCVHCAPGHGPEDFEACIPYKIPPLCPVDEEGKFTEEAGKYSKTVVKKDDKGILEDLKDKGVLLRSYKIFHRYGHCWRCRTPIIYRATEQWFINVTALKSQMIEETKKVDWVPEWAGSARFMEWIKNARDWTISRQRYWGIPLPIWVCESCGSLKVIESHRELEKMGIKLEELYKPFVDDVKLKCKCGGTQNRVPDVLDVWFDSGVAAWASLGYPNRDGEFETWYPADFITEGHDQTRGWFYSQLGCGLIAFDKVPYRRVLMHGFTLDEKGKKMSKSLGNVVRPEEVIEKYGVEVLRYYVLWANKPWDDLRFNWEEVRVVQRMFNVFWNVYVFATTYMSIDGFDPKQIDKKIKDAFGKEDKFILSRLNSMMKEVTEAFESLYIHQATRTIQEFILEDLSRWYIPLIRPRTWIEKDDPEKLSAYAVLHEVLTKLSMIMAPFAPHISEEMYKNLSGAKESVHMEKWPQFDEKAIDTELEKKMVGVRRYVEAESAAREKKGIKRRWPVIENAIIPKDREWKRIYEEMTPTIDASTTTMNFKVLDPDAEVPGTRIKIEPNLSTLGPEFKEKADEIIEKLRVLDGEEVRKKIKKGYEIKIGGEKVTLQERHVNFSEEIPERFSITDFEFGRAFIDTEKSPDVIARGFAREVVRRIQEMRKEQDMDIEAFIAANVEVKDSEIVKLLKEKKQKDYIKTETRARQLNIAPEIKHKGYEKEWIIEGERFVISISEL